MSDIKHSGFVAGTGEYITASTTADLAAEIDALRAELAAANAEIARLRHVVEKMVAFGEIWAAEGTLSETEAELFDAAHDALEGV